MEKRQYFFNFPPTTEGKGFRKNNKPTEQIFRELLASVPFHRERSSTGSEDVQGLFKAAKLRDILNRGATYNDSVREVRPVRDINDPETTDPIYRTRKSVMPYQMPVFYPFDTDFGLDQSKEVARTGIGISSREMAFRQDYVFRLRLDTLRSTVDIRPKEDFIIISRPGSSTISDRSMMISMEKFLEMSGGDFYTMSVRPTSFIFKQGNENKATFTLFKNGLRINFESLEHIVVTKSPGLSLAEPKIISGQLEIEVLGSVEAESGITVEYYADVENIDNTLPNAEAYTHVVKDVSMDTYELLASPTVININRETGAKETRIQLIKNGSSISFEQHTIDLNDNNLPSYITYTIEPTSAQKIAYKIIFAYSNAAPINPSPVSYAMNIHVKEDGVFDTERMVIINDTESAPTVKLEFSPSTAILQINYETGLADPPYNALLKKMVDGVYTHMDPSDVGIMPMSGYQIGPLVQAPDGIGVHVPIIIAGDGSSIRASLNSNPDVSADINVVWGSQIEAVTEFLASPPMIIFKANGDGTSSNERFFTTLYLKNSMNEFLNLTKDDVIVSPPPGIFVTVTERTNSNSISYLEISVDSWIFPNSTTVLNIGMTNESYPNTVPYQIGLSKVIDGSGMSIDAQGSGEPAGKGYIDEEAGFTYLDTDDTYIYFKIGDPGTDTWTDGTPFGRGEDGAPGLPPAHQWTGTALTFVNPDGSLGDTVDLLGQTGEAGVPAMPVSVDVDQHTGFLVLTYQDEQGNMIQLPSSVSVIGPAGRDGSPGQQGDPGIPITWRGELPHGPSDAAVNHAYYDTTLKQSFIMSSAGNWDTLAKDGKKLW